MSDNNFFRVRVRVPIGNAEERSTIGTRTRTRKKLLSDIEPGLIFPLKIFDS